MAISKATPHPAILACFNGPFHCPKIRQFSWQSVGVRLCACQSLPSERGPYGCQLRRNDQQRKRGPGAVRWWKGRGGGGGGRKRGWGSTGVLSLTCFSLSLFLLLPYYLTVSVPCQRQATLAVAFHCDTEAVRFNVALRPQKP